MESTRGSLSPELGSCDADLSISTEAGLNCVDAHSLA